MQIFKRNDFLKHSLEEYVHKGIEEKIELIKKSTFQKNKEMAFTISLNLFKMI